MPKSLPEGALKIWEKVYDQAIKDGDKEDVAAKKSLGWCQTGRMEEE